MAVLFVTHVFSVAFRYIQYAHRYLNRFGLYHRLQRYSLIALYFTLYASLLVGAAFKKSVTGLYRWLLVRPHLHLTGRYYWYRNYHALPARRILHSAVLGIYVVSTMGFLFVHFARTFAGDTMTSWDFSNANHYTLADGLEIDTNQARLKAQNYSDDADTAALYHLDEIVSPTAVDSSSNGNDGNVNGGDFTTGNLNGALELNGTNTNVRIPDSASLALGQQHTIEAWTKLQDDLSAHSIDQRQGIVDNGDYSLYYDNETGKIVYELANNAPSTWTQVAGNDIKGSWDINGKMMAASSVAMGGTLYVGTGHQIGDAEVWVKDGATWTMIGGDGINNSWADQMFEAVRSLTTDGTHIYAGLGDSAGDGEVWRWNGAEWTMIGGDTINSSWQFNTFEAVQSLLWLDGHLYAGLGNSASDAEIWRWDGDNWTRIAGDNQYGGWGNGFEQVLSMVTDGTHIYAGLGTSTGDAEVWRYHVGTSIWTKIGGDGVNSSWNTVYESVRSLYWHAGTLYAGTGDSANDAGVWSWDGNSWSQIGGDGIAESWDTGYEYVSSLLHDGNYLYAGLGSSNGDGELYRYSAGSWTKIGGDGVNGGWSTARGDVVSALTSLGGLLYTSLYDSAGGSYVYSWDGASWTVEGGEYINESWGYYGLGSVETLFTLHGKLYAGTGLAIGSAQVWEYNGDSDYWTIVGGQGIRGSWEPDVFELITAMNSYEGNLVVGLGNSANDAQVWSYDGNSWTKIGGQGDNGSWTTTFEEVPSLASHDGFLYAGLGVSANDAEVWRWDGNSWTKIGGDNLNGGWNTGFERVMSMTIYNGQLHAGLGTSANDAEVWSWNGNLWTKIGGDGVNSSWSDNIEQVESMIAYAGKLYVGTGLSASDGDVWEWDGTAWTQIGGDGINNSWDAGTYELVRSLTTYNGDLYAGLGSSAGDGEVWRWNGSVWEKMGGNFVNGGWGNTMEEVEALSVYRGKLYAGTGNTANADAAVWVYGNNGYLASDTSGFDTRWRHIAATYDGTTMRLHIDGQLDTNTDIVLSVADSDHDLLLGSTHGAIEQGMSQGYFKGLLDEIRISSTVRPSFTSRPYATTPQVLSLATAALQAGTSSLDGFETTETPDGGTITYRLSNDDGTTWLYWDGAAWSVSNDLTLSNAAGVVNTNIEHFPTSFYGVKWQAILSGDGNQRPGLQEVSISSNADVASPETNASAIFAYRSNGGNMLSSNDWTNGASPYFTWTAGNDSDSGVKGYCLYLGTDGSADPVSTKGLLGDSPEYPSTFCQFMVTSESVDLASPGFMSAPMTTSNNPYYLRIKTIDNAGNVSNDTAQFQFRFDNTPPTNPGYVTAPSGFINTKEVTLTWPTNGAQAPSDSGSGLAGLQYRINDSAWYGDSHTGTGDINDLLTNDGNYMTAETPDFANLQEGINTVYFRTWDQAGNVTSTYATATIKLNTAGSPSEPQNLSVNPGFSVQNSFSFSWTPPVTFVGEVNNLTYCYTVNVLPSSTSCTFTGSGATNLPAGPYATQPGANTLYLVARDESNNINYDSYSSVQFTANTPAPGIPSSTDIVDASVKATSKWRLAITWEEPDYEGSGVTSYRVFRSTNNTNFHFVGSSSSTTYIDANLSQQMYYYYIRACDNTNNCGAPSTTVSQLPTGRFTEPAALTSSPQTSNVTTKKATIAWTTDRTSDSKVLLGTASGQYAASEIGNSEQVTLHTLQLDNLAAGTTYYYIARWTDEDGNTGSSQEFTFTTAPAPVIKDIETLSIGLSSATVQFTSVGASKVNIYFGQSDAFGGLKSVNTSKDESTYTFNLDGLNDGTRYSYRLSAFDDEGEEYTGNTFSFTTPPRPRINNLRFQPVPGQPTSTQLVSWQTNIASTSGVSYGVVGSTGREQQNSELKTSHEMRISNLQDDSTYFLVAQSRDANGNLAVSDRQQFRTALDSRPPKITEIAVESSIRGTGAEARGQVIITWKTDEPATSQVGYAEGSSATIFNSRTAEDSELATEHLVIISDLPTSKVYSLQPITKDKAGNIGLGEPQSAIIGRASESVLTVILNTLQRVFGL